MTDTKRLRWLPLHILAIGGSLAALPALATDYTVTTTADNLEVDGEISLREAVNAASSNVAVGDAPAGEASDTITIGGATYVLSQGELSVSGTTTITGSGTIDGGGQSRILSVSGSAGETVTLSGVTLTNGRTSPVSMEVMAEAVQTRNGSDTVNGGAIIVNAGATMELSGVTLSNNTATGAARGEGGGAIFNAGTVTITGSTISDNTVTGAAGNGGGIIVVAGGVLTATDTTISGNSAGRAGGGIENDGGTVTLNNVSLLNNEIGPNPGNGGGLHQGGNSSVTVNGGVISGNIAAREGAGLWAAATSVIDGTMITNNVANGLAANQGGAGLFNQGGNMTVRNATITGNMAINDDNGTGSASGGGILNNASSATPSDTVLLVENSIISNNKANRAGGGIEDNGGTVTLTNVTMDGNETGTDFARPGNGGAVHGGGGGTFVVNGGTFTNNIAAREGGGLWTTGESTFTGITVTGNEGQEGRTDNGGGGGGGLFNQGGNMTVVDSTIDNNRATGSNGSGGGIHNNGGSLTITGGTVNGNVANRAGGALEDNAGTEVTITNVTMNNNIAGPEGNAAPGNGGAIHITGVGNMTITGSMFSGNIAGSEGGALWNGNPGSIMIVEGSVIDGNTAMGNDADTGGGGLFNNGGTLTVRATPATDTAMMVKTTIINNVANGTAGSGGGILNDGGTLIVEDTDITGNSAVRAGGGLEDSAVGGTPTTTTLTRVTLDGNSTGSSPGNGGAQHVTGPGTVTVDRSTVSNNTASNEGGGLWGHNSSTLNVYNSTVSGNTAPLGGGVFSQEGANATVSIINSTIANNSGSGIGVGDETSTTTAATITLMNTIVAGNTVDLTADVTATNSLIQNPGDVTVATATNVLGQDPQLGALADNGGPTLTQVAETGPAVDGGDNVVCAGDEINNIDQRNIARPAEGSNLCDIGATEFAAMPAAAAAVNNPADAEFEPGDQDVPAVGFSITPADEDITVTALSGVITGGELGSISGGQLSVNGVPLTGTFNLNDATGAFSIVLDNGQILMQNAAGNITVSLDFARSSTMLAGFGLLGLPMLLLLWMRRSRAALALLAAGGLTLAACSDSEQDFNGVQVTVQQVTATGNTTGGNVVVAGLPVTGARLSSAPTTP